MAVWEYATLTLRVSKARVNQAGYFSRAEMVKQIDPESEAAMNEMGKAGWELVSVTPLDFGTYGSGDGFAAAIFKRHPHTLKHS